MTVLSVENLNITVHTRSAVLPVVHDVSFEIGSNETLGIVGESGCRKTTIGRLPTRLESADAGEAWFDGREILRLTTCLSTAASRDPDDLPGSLHIAQSSAHHRADPGRTLRIHGMARTAAARQRIASMLEKVGLDAAVMHRHPHEFSGGQQQRIGIARVMLVEPRRIIADQAVSALDVSIQAQVLNLIKALQQDSGVSMLFIGHDLGVVRHLYDRIAVMNDGEIVELADKHDLFKHPQHPFTQRLLDTIPRLDRYRDPP